MITLIPLSGFLGAGKTTTMIAAAKSLEAAGRTVSVITNDQGVDLVDTAKARAALSGVGEVTGGCFCCRFEDLIGVVSELVAQRNVDTVIAEAVGSCTDLQATVVRPLRELYGSRFVVSPLTTVVEPLRYKAFSGGWERGESDSELSYLFDRQLAEADVLALNKIDITPPDLIPATVQELTRRYPHAIVAPYSARTGEGLARLLKAWNGPLSIDRDVDVDYDRYAAAEAELAWLNRVYEVTGTETDFVPDTWIHQVLGALSELCAADGVTVGHAKVSLRTSEGTVNASVTAAGATPSLDGTMGRPATRGQAVFNVRVACPPEIIEAMIDRSVAVADRSNGVVSEVVEGTAFRPSYPRPVHRLRPALVGGTDDHR
ncbi:MAG TPA: GTP-binding protein [Micromonosporaceae bacterium]